MWYALRYSSATNSPIRKPPLPNNSDLHVTAFLIPVQQAKAMAAEAKPVGGGIKNTPPRPNTRVQRTRSHFTLTRSPLGGSTMAADERFEYRARRRGYMCGTDGGTAFPGTGWGPPSPGPR